MGSQSVFVTCHHCDKVVSRAAKRCPECGKQLKGMGTFHWLVIMAAGVVLIGLIMQDEGAEGGSKVSPEQSAVDAEPATRPLPAAQRRFVKTVNEHVAMFSQVKNELQESTLRDHRAQSLAKVIPDLEVTEWIGTIKQLDTNTEGKAILSVSVAPNVEVTTWNNAISDIGANTLIEKGSPVYRTLFDLSRGQEVLFSGRFLPSQQDHFRESSLTIHGSMTQPEYLFQFTFVDPID